MHQYSDWHTIVIGTVALDWWSVTFRTVKKEPIIRRVPTRHAAKHGLSDDASRSVLTST